MKYKLKDFITDILIVAMLCLSLNFGYSRYKASDSYIRHRVVYLYGNNHACSGVEVKAPSGKNYILTAGHCRILASDDRIMARDENGREQAVEVIQEDPNSDLLLLASIDGKSVDVAKSIHAHEHLHSITHGKSFPAYRTDGEFLDIELTQIKYFPIMDANDRAKCLTMPKYSDYTGMTGEFCFISTHQTLADVPIVLGSSGGPLLNEAGELVGIVSAGSSDGFNTFVSLMDIHSFLKDK